MLEFTRYMDVCPSVLHQSALPLQGLEEDAALWTLLEGTAGETGERFFAALVQNLARALNTEGAWVTEYLENSRRLRALAFWMNGEWIHDFAYDIAGTPCEPAIASPGLVHFPQNIVALFPDDPYLKEFRAVSYMGIRLADVNGRILGLLAVLDSRPIPEEPRAHAIFQIFAARAAAELQRLRAEAAVREREEQLARLVDGAMDAIIQLDGRLAVTRINAAAEKAFGCPAREMTGRPFAAFLASDAAESLARLAADLDARPEGQRSAWISGGLKAVSAEGRPFRAEATLSRYELRREPFYALILRNVEDRLEAERRIRTLTDEARYLREEIKALHGLDAVIGQSEALLRVLRDVREVAETDATVLIMGETGTGKELVAHAIHDGSRRGDRPLVRVNCAAIPVTLIESEFFGHERGAFTGATRRRDGRFTLADGGTIFLDEIGELPIDVQGKLLRVLQEKEFEPVGSSRTRKVDVRVIAASNRDLRRAVRTGTFREDLYFRLSVFPIELPPLRERGEDIALLAAAFAQRFARRIGRAIEPLSAECIQRLQAYPWPGNVRELQNVIERAVITSQDGRLSLDRALPEIARQGPPALAPPPDAPAASVRTARELRELERDNLRRALDATGWRVAGRNGAASLLGMNPSTLASRMKALGISRSGSRALVTKPPEEPDEIS
jgi:PAS domain S-box-containing protein